MAGVLEQLLILCNQLTEIGYDNPEVLIAGLFIVAAIAIMIVALIISVVLSIPISIIWGISRLCVWLYRRKHPVQYVEPEESYSAKSRLTTKHTRRKGNPFTESEVEELPPVYPDWLTKKSGRLL